MWKKLVQKETVFQLKMINMLHFHLPAEGGSYEDCLRI